jgi:NADH dehydrogenase [ubiquinone] 1 alpha subcomplex assembly factor 7
VSREIRERIARAIADHGPITFAEFMALALTSPGGYFERPPVGEDGDFVTSPHVHPVFADLLRFALGELHSALGSPRPSRLVELGAGDGTLARQLIQAYAEIEHLEIEYRALEVSAGARAELRRLGVRAVERVDELDRDLACVIANELLDNLPFRRVVSTEAGPREIRIGSEDGAGFSETLAEVPPDLVMLIGPMAPETEIVVPTGALELIDGLAPRISGYLLLIDYPGDVRGGVRGYRGHRVVTDVLDDPGSADITAGVDLDAIVRRAQAHGLRELGRVTQRDALVTLGFDRWDEGQLRRQTLGLSDRHTDEAIGAWDSRRRANLLVDPEGLGGLTWLLLGRPGLPSPRWLDRAGARSRTQSGRA